MGNVASLGVKAKRYMRGILSSRRIQGLELGKKAFFFLSGVIISIPLTIHVREFVRPLFFKIPMFKGRLFYLLIFQKAIFTPLLEEFAKAYPIMYRSDDNERSLVTLGSLVGLGFGVAESILYIFGSKGAPINVRLLPTLFHAASTAITAYGITKNQPIRSYLVAVTLHSLNNLSSVLRLPWIISIYPVLLATFSIAVYLHRKTSPPSLPEFRPTSSRIVDYELTRND